MREQVFQKVFHVKVNGQAIRQSDSQTVRQTDRQTDGQTDGQTFLPITKALRFLKKSAELKSLNFRLVLPWKLVGMVCS